MDHIRRSKTKEKISNPKTCPSLFEGQISISNDQNYKQKKAIAHQKMTDEFWKLVLVIYL
jgi:hypothetical protein